MQENFKKISNVEWGLVIGALLVIDVIQILLDFVAIGIALNRIIDFFVGGSFAFYLHMRGQTLANPKRLFGILGVFGLEMIPGVDALPLWSLDGIYNFIMYRREAKKAEADAKKAQQNVVYMRNIQRTQNKQENVNDDVYKKAA